jgi:hypothetical protein
MCLAMNPDKLLPGERRASASNRNFEGRQGFKGRTHLVSPAMAAAAIAGHFVSSGRWGAWRLALGVGLTQDGKLHLWKELRPVLSRAVCSC